MKFRNLTRDQQICNIESVKRRIECKKDAYKILWLYEHALSGFSSNANKNKKIKKTRVLLNEDISSLNKFEAFLHINSLHYSKYNDIKVDKYENYDFIILQDFKHDFSSLLSNILNQTNPNCSVIFTIKEQEQVDEFCKDYSEIQATKEAVTTNNLNSIPLFCSSLFKTPHIVLTETFKVLNVNIPNEIIKKTNETKPVFESFKKEYKNKKPIKLILDLEQRKFGRFLFDYSIHLISRKRSKNKTFDIFIMGKEIENNNFFPSFKQLVELQISKTNLDDNFSKEFDDGKLTVTNIKTNSQIIIQRRSSLNLIGNHDTVIAVPTMNDFILDEYTNGLNVHYSLLLNDPNKIYNEQINAFIANNNIERFKRSKINQENKDILRSFLKCLNPLENIKPVTNIPTECYTELKEISLRELNTNRSLIETIHNILITHSYFFKSEIVSNFEMLINREDNLSILFVKEKGTENIDNVTFVYNSSSSLPGKVFENNLRLSEFDINVYLNCDSILKQIFANIDYITGVYIVEENSNYLEKNKILLKKIKQFYKKEKPNTCYVVQTKLERDIFRYYFEDGYIPFYYSDRKDTISSLYIPNTRKEEQEKTHLATLLFSLKRRFTEILLETSPLSDKSTKLISFIKLVEIGIEDREGKIGEANSGDISGLKYGEKYNENVLKDMISFDIEHLKECRHLIIGQLKELLINSRISNFSQIRIAILIAFFFHKSDLDVISEMFKMEKECVLDEIKKIFKLFN
eukprot:GAHX01002458.1.p1 GENE.GAHX01002458.1~~GAHX01002458.1.p1  ORF type:complete len:747 (+),score=170.15 GAHX01002458.1:1389-3629(+)